METHFPIPDDVDVKDIGKLLVDAGTALETAHRAIAKTNLIAASDDGYVALVTIAAVLRVVDLPLDKLLTTLGHACAIGASHLVDGGQIPGHFAGDPEGYFKAGGLFVNAIGAATAMTIKRRAAEDMAAAGEARIQ